jgi:hypothetical protein
MKKGSVLGAVVGLAVTVVVISVVVYYGSRAWKKGQTGEKLV